MQVDAVIGASETPPPDGIWDIIPGWPWPPLMNPNDNPPPGQP